MYLKKGIQSLLAIVITLYSLPGLSFGLPLDGATGFGGEDTCYLCATGRQGNHMCDIENTDKASPNAIGVNKCFDDEGNSTIKDYDHFDKDRCYCCAKSGSITEYCEGYDNPSDGFIRLND